MFKNWTDQILKYISSFKSENDLAILPTSYLPYLWPGSSSVNWWNIKRLSIVMPKLCTYSILLRWHQIIIRMNGMSMVRSCAFRNVLVKQQLPPQLPLRLITIYAFTLNIKVFLQLKYTTIWVIRWIKFGVISKHQTMAVHNWWQVVNIK